MRPLVILVKKMKKNSYFRIQGDLVEEVEETVRKTFSLDSIHAAMQSQAGISTGLIPRDTIYMKRQMRNTSHGDVREDTIFILEREPKVVSLTYRDGTASSSAKVGPIKVSLPFVMMAIIVNKEGVIGDIWPFCSKKRVKTMNDPIFVLPLPNVHDSGHGRLCVGDLKVPSKAGIQDKLQSIYKTFFSSEFNLDLTPEWPSSFQDANGGIGMYGYEHQTSKNPLFGISKDVSYRPHSAGTVNGLLEYVGFSRDA